MESLNRVVRRLLRTYGRHAGMLEDLYADDVVFYTPLARLEGRPAVSQYFAELNKGFPGLRLALHDEFHSEDSRRACIRLRFDWHNTGQFYGHPPTGASGVQIETHTLRIDDEGRIVEQIAGVSTFQLPKLFLADWGMDFPREIPDPSPEIFSASPATSRSLSGVEPNPTLGLRFVDAFGRRDHRTLAEIYAPDVELFTPLGWPVRGLSNVQAFVDEFHASNPGMKVALHDEFASADRTRVCWRIKLHYRNSAPFYGNPATNDEGVMTETHATTLRDGRISQQVVGDNTFHMPFQELVQWKMPFPTDTQDPNPALATVQPS